MKKIILGAQSNLKGIKQACGSVCIYYSLPFFILSLGHFKEYEGASFRRKWKLWGNTRTILELKFQMHRTNGNLEPRSHNVD